MKIRYIIALVMIIFGIACLAYAEETPDQKTALWGDHEDEEVKSPDAPLPVRESPYQEAVLQGLDKATGRISTIKAPIDQAMMFGTLKIVARYCYQSGAEDTPESAAFLEITDEKAKQDVKKLFTGWMFASSPAVSAMDHAVYDISVSGCRKPRQVAAPEAVAPAVVEPVEAPAVPAN